jgi:hypothetical protein
MKRGPDSSSKSLELLYKSKPVLLFAALASPALAIFPTSIIIVPLDRHSIEPVYLKTFTCNILFATGNVKKGRQKVYMERTGCSSRLQAGYNIQQHTRSLNACGSHPCQGDW